MPYTKEQRQLGEARRKKEEQEEDQAAQKRNEEERKANERRKKTEEVKENNQQEIEEAMKKSKQEEEHSNHAYRNTVSPQIERPDKGINNLKMSPGHLGQNRKMRKYDLRRGKVKKRIRERIKKI